MLSQSHLLHVPAAFAVYSFPQKHSWDMSKSMCHAFLDVGSLVVLCLWMLTLTWLHIGITYPCLSYLSLIAVGITWASRFLFPR